MMMILILIYGLGIGLWLYIWHKVKGFSLTKENKLLHAPFFLVIFILAIQPIISFLYSIKIGNVDLEINLIRIIELNTVQLIQSNVGILIVAPIIISIIGKKVPRDFILLQALSIVFIAGGVLPIYWTPSEDGNFLYYLRHIKTVPYTIGIGCLIAGGIILMKQLASSETKESNED